jgi:hypothetical protein
LQLGRLYAGGKWNAPHREEDHEPVASWLDAVDDDLAIQIATLDERHLRTVRPLPGTKAFRLPPADAWSRHDPAENTKLAWRSTREEVTWWTARR